MKLLWPANPFAIEYVPVRSRTQKMLQVVYDRFQDIPEVLRTLENCASIVHHYFGDYSHSLGRKLKKRYV